MSSEYLREMLNKIISVLTNFARVEIDSFDISEEKQLHLNSIGILFDNFYNNGIAIRFSLYTDNPVYIMALISKEAIYEISERMNLEIDTEFEKVRYNDEMLSAFVEIVNLMTATVAENYARRINQRVIYSPPKIVRHLFSPDIIKGIEIRGRKANIIAYNFFFKRPASGIKLLLIY